MTRNTEASPKAPEYRNKETGETVGAYAGTELDKVYAKDADYEVVGDRTLPPEQETSRTQPRTAARRSPREAGPIRPTSRA
jgi:hypothetical protein